VTLPRPSAEPDDPTWRARLRELFGTKPVSDFLAQHATYQRLSAQMRLLEQEREALQARYHEAVDLGRSPDTIEKKVKALDEKVANQRHHMTTLRRILMDRLPTLTEEWKTALGTLFSQVCAEQQERADKANAVFTAVVRETLPEVLRAESALSQPREFFRPVQQTLRAGDLDAITTLLKEITNV
jgi:hypothetical protein